MPLKRKVDATCEVTRSCAPPKASSTVNRDRPKPLSASNAASAAGPCSSEVSARMRAPGWRCGRIRSTGRPCSETVAASCSAQPRRDAARLKADGAGSTRISDGIDCRQSVTPTPKKNGSPEASTTTGRAAQRHDRLDGTLERAQPQHGVSPAISGAASSRCAPAAEDDGSLGDAAAWPRRRDRLDHLRRGRRSSAMARSLP